MEYLTSFLIAALIGLIVYFICQVVIFLSPYADVIAVIVFLLVFVTRLGVL